MPASELSRDLLGRIDVCCDVVKEKAPKSAVESDARDPRRKGATLDPGERRGRILAIMVLSGLFATPFYLEYLQLSPSDLMTGLGGPDAARVAMIPVGVSAMGWVRLVLWNSLLLVVLKGYRWARKTLGVLCVIRGGVAIYYAIRSGFVSELAVLFVGVGVGYLIAALFMLGVPDLDRYLDGRHARLSRSGRARSAAR